MQNLPTRAKSAGQLKSRARFGPKYLARLGPTVTSVHLLVDGIPRTSLPSDVLRTLKENHVVDDDYSLSNVSAPPISLPRTVSLTRTYHLSFSSRSEALDVHHRITNLVPPLFPLHAFSSPYRHLASACDFTTDDAAQWRRRLMHHLEADLERTRHNRGQAPPELARFDVQWMEENHHARGRKVLVQGLPRYFPPNVAMQLARQDMADPEIKRLPWSIDRDSSTWVFAFPTVAQAYRFARRTNMTPAPAYDGLEPFTMRARVLW